MFPSYYERVITVLVRYTATAIHLSYGEQTFNTIAGIQDAIVGLFDILDTVAN